MAKELLIVFLYDTEVHLREEEDPQSAVVYFHPSWVSANQRMALCGQLIGVTQFLHTGFSFPHIISLNCGKFAMKKIGRYIMCVGTDRNIPDWILEKRCEMLHDVLLFFHCELNSFHENCKADMALEKLTNVMEVYLPILLCAGNIFATSPTIRLPKSASTIFLEAAQILECLQNKDGVYGGAIFHQNKVVMSQLNTDITKLIAMMDPFRIKVPVDVLDITFHLPVGVQLLVVYVDSTELQILEEQKIPSVKNEKENENSLIINGKKKFSDNIKSKIDTVPEEETEPELLKFSVSDMPDLVRDTVKNVTKNDQFSGIEVQSYVVDPIKKMTRPNSCSVENLELSHNNIMKYHSFNCSNDSNEKSPENLSISIKKKKSKQNTNKFYNTISDPVYPWFRANGLPASKAFHDDRIEFYCHDIGKTKQSETESLKEENFSEVVGVNSNPKRPTSIPLNTNETVSKKNKMFRLHFKAEISESKSECVPQLEKDVPVTPLMSKLSMLDLSQSKKAFSCTKLNTPSGSKTFPLTEDSPDSKNESFCSRTKIDCSRKISNRKKARREETTIDLKKTILFVYGCQNISLYLLLNFEQAKNPELIHFLWKTCHNSTFELERHFRQCFESIPQTHSLNGGNESYSFVQIHSAWETLQRSGSWMTPQTDLLNSLHDDLNHDPSITDVTVRLEESVVYGNQIGDSQVFYLQNVSSVAGLPMPSDLMGVVPLKAKRRLERDHGLLIL